MNAVRISLLDFSGPLELGKSLRTMLVQTPEFPAIVQHEQFSVLELMEVSGRLPAELLISMADLLVLLWSQETQLHAPRVFHTLLRRGRSVPPVVVVPPTDEPGLIREFFRLGASEYVISPFRIGDVRPRLERLLPVKGSREKPLIAAKDSLGLRQIIGESPALIEEVQKIPRMAQCDACVLITGETGTGKEVCARAIHYLSARADRPFVPLNCGAIPTDLLENELFGHEVGAFTSANARSAGVISEAHRGTLFLDEIDSLPVSAQVKLLRFLQDKEYRPLGGRKSAKADVRIVAASNARMDELLGSGRIRQDLFYRLNVLPLHLPPLRRRKEDIPLLARHFVAKYATHPECRPLGIAPDALHKLSLYDWPGNVRELENIIERAVVLSASEVICSADIDLPVEPAEEPESFRLLKAKVIAEFEETYLRAILQRHAGNIGQAARAARKNRRAFFQLMRKHRIRVERSPVDNRGPRVDKNVLLESAVI